MGTIAGVVIVLVVILLFGRRILARWARWTARGRMDARAVSAAQGWLRWSAWLEPGNGHTDLMQAACFRYLGQIEGWAAAMQSAEGKEAPASAIRQEVKLELIRSGEMYEGAVDELGTLIQSGLSPHDVAGAFVRGYLARGEFEKARLLLDVWAEDHPQAADVAYVRGLYWGQLGQGARAEADFRNALAGQPEHELARRALADLLEREDRLDEALRQYAELATRAPRNETAKVGLARMLRKLGRGAEARALLEPIISQPEPSADALAEMGQIEEAAGNHDQAEQWFERIDLERSEDYEALSAAATVFALRGSITRAERLFARARGTGDRLFRIHDLRARLAVDPTDIEASRELERLQRSSPTPDVEAFPNAGQPSGDGQPPDPAARAQQLYAQHCSACHGPRGDGEGRAARHLFPRPRDLRAGKHRLVSTRNLVPTTVDVEAGIRRGMPGTAMRPFDDLSADQRRLLTEEVVRMQREGMREHLADALREQGEEIDEEELREIVEDCTTPGEVVRVPTIGPPDPPAVARGRETYLKAGCDKCHGEDGTGVWDTELFDEDGLPFVPRDLVHEPFKGGQEPESIYLRVFLGMPGTPHPGSFALPEDELIDLVQYCRSLAREPKRELTNYQRGLQATCGGYLSAAGQPDAVSKTNTSQ